MKLPKPILLFYAGLGILGPPVAFIGLGLEAGVTLCATGFAVAWLLWNIYHEPADPQSVPATLLIASGATAFSSLALLPSLGIRFSAAIGFLMLAAGWALGRRHSLRQDLPEDTQSASPRPPPWFLTLAAGAAVAWARCLSLLWGHTFYALCALMATVLAGHGFGVWLRRRYSVLLDAEEAACGLAACGAGGIGILGLWWLGFIGINAGAAEYLHSARLDLSDFFFIVLQSLPCIWAWAAFIPLASRQMRSPGMRDAAAVLAGPMAAAILIPRLGPSAALAGFHLAFMLAGLVLAGRRLWRMPVLSKVAPAVFAAALILGYKDRNIFPAIWINRLNSALNGGRFLELHEDGREYLGVYQFSSGAEVLIREGMAWANLEPGANRQVHLPLLMHGQARRVLLAGVRQPATIRSALAHRVAADVLDPHPDAGRILNAFGTYDWPAPYAPLTGQAQFIRGGLRGHLRRSGQIYDAILVELPMPAHAPESALQSTVEAFRQMRKCLRSAGVVAVRLPAPYPPRYLARLVRNIREIFPHAGGYDLVGGYLIIASENILHPDTKQLLARRNALVQTDDFELEDALAAMAYNDFTQLPPAALKLRPDHDDRSWGAFALGELWRGPQLTYQGDSVLRR